MTLTPLRSAPADARARPPGSSHQGPPPRTAGRGVKGARASAGLFSLASARFGPRLGQGTSSRPDDFEVPSSLAAPHSADHPAASFLRVDQEALDDFTRLWEQGEVGGVEEYLARMGVVAPRLTVELVYREFCLAELAGRRPEPQAYFARFPEHRETLERLLSIHREWNGSRGPGWPDPADTTEVLPEAGDEIGPYLLRRELGRGAFARVFLAEQGDLENRPVVVKLSTRPTREPWLLARARHAHIVEILSHAEVDDGAFQLICMPFLGGATLSAVLERRRGNPGPPRARGNLLRDLDAVAAPEYSGANPARPARELLGGLTDARALAWITARLAEALDHAFGRDVAHGDVKPSNILLTADGNPMLLDFNLARDGSPRGPRRPLEDLGGTLAYMAPERLRTIALDPCRKGYSSYGRPADPEGDCEPADPGAHLADLYALGMVLLEALTGTPPAPPPSGEGSHSPSTRGLSVLAAGYARARERGAEALIRSAEAAGRPIPSALRVILGRCLAVRPEGRYRRALELAEDLDRWRTDRPLAYAEEPFWTQTLPRVVRRRRSLISTAAIALAVSLVTTSLVMNASQSMLQSLALNKLARYWDDIESRVFQFHRPGSPRLQNPDSPDVLAVAAHALKDYGVVGEGEWLQGDEVRSLPPADRDDLELWLMEQAFRYCRALGNRRGSPADWARASSILDRVDATPPLQSLEILRRRLTSKLSRDEAGGLSPGPGGPSQGHAPEVMTAQQHPRHPWVDEYLMGLAAELEDDPAPGRADGPDVVSTTSIGALHVLASSGEPPRPTDSPGARKALGYYGRVLTWRPDSFWGHYRAAVVCFRLNRWAEAAAHLDACLHRRPGISALRGQLASCLWKMGALDQAMEECNRAVESAPDHPEFHQSRAFVRAERGETGGLADDLGRYELLRQMAGTPLRRSIGGRVGEDDRSGGGTTSRLALDLDSAAGFAPAPVDSRLESEESELEELDVRAVLAATIYKADAGLRENDTAEESMSPRPKSEAVAIADAELDKVLALRPGHIVARMIRMMGSLKQGRNRAAQEDLDQVLSHPDLVNFLSTDPDGFAFLHLAAQRFARRGLVADALKIADTAIFAAVQLNLPRGRSHYYKATIHAIAAQSDTGQIDLAAEQLDFAFKAHARFREWYRVDTVFHPVRVRIDAALDQMAEAAREN